MPLAWYFWPQWEYHYGRWWKDQFCHDWFQREREADKFAISLWRCPCTMRQSELDRGRYAPDTQCSVYTRNCDPFYKRALHCIKSGRPSVGGSGQTCCYDMDGELILTADTMYGGKPHRYFSYGELSTLREESFAVELSLLLEAKKMASLEKLSHSFRCSPL